MSKSQELTAKKMRKQEKMTEGRRIQNLMAGGADQRLEEYVERYLKQKEPAALNELKSETSAFTTCTSPLGNAREVEVHRNPSGFYF